MNSQMTRDFVQFCTLRAHHRDEVRGSEVELMKTRKSSMEDGLGHNIVVGASGKS